MSNIIAFAEQAYIPVITTFKGKGLIQDHHPLACGVLGRSGTPVTADFMDRADRLIVLGASFSKHTGIATGKPTIQVDFDASILGKFHPVTLPMWGEITKTVDYWREALGTQEVKPDPLQEVAQQWAAWRQEKARRVQIDQGKGLNSALIFQVLSDSIPANAVIAVDVGNNTYSFGRYFESKGQAVLMSGYLGSIGYGVPAAIGAWAAAPERPIVAVTGDGGFGQYMGELTTAVKYKIPIKHILLNNSELGKISKEQRVEGKEVWATTLHNPNFAQFAENCGAWGLRVSTKQELEDGIIALFDSDGPALLEIISDAELI
jgi:thiamine pyrophosphate-dependent acetolactate synthase large subunit-like protein